MKQQKKIIIIGASSGIGKELAALYANQGCIIGITGRRSELLENLQKTLISANAAFGTIVFVECFDVTGTDNLVHVQSLIRQMGGLDLLIYNSGYGKVTPVMDYAIDKKIIDTNVQGFLEIVNYSYNFFLNQGSGHIAATSSVGSNRGSSYSPAYSASKAFMSNYMEGLYIKARKSGAAVYVTDIQPGFVNSKKPEGNKQFWVVPVKKAAVQIKAAIDRKSFRVYISRRWWLIAKLMRMMPMFIYRRFG